MQYRNQAAVLIIIATNSANKEDILLTQRAEHLALHGGEVAFPGGKWEEDDSDLRHTALRESHEEVGVQPSRVNIVQQLPVAYTRSRMSVTPYVGRIDSYENLKANQDELQSLFWVPIEFFLEDRRARTDVFDVNGKELWAPVYQWEEYTIWGFTARVIVDFLNRMYSQNITRRHAAPEVIYAGA